VNNIPKKKSWGKLVGGVLGMCVGGPWGAAAGVVIGHLHDTRAENDTSNWSTLWGSYGDFAANIEQAAFTMGVVVLSAKMAKSDGRVTRAEIEAFKKVFHIAPAQEAAVGRLFDKARLSADGFEPYAFQLAHVFRHNAAVLEEILSGLFIIAAADYAGLSPAEVAFLKRISFIFGFSGPDFVRIAARSGVHLPQNEKQTSPEDECFAILGISQDAAPDQIKSAYRALIRKHHPDKLMAQGVPPEFVATATEKMKRINVAYDTACRLRGIK